MKRMKNSKPRLGTAADGQSGNGFDFAPQWADELGIIIDHGPFSEDEITKLSPQQTAEYFFVTSCILREEGTNGFIAARKELRGMLLRRLQAGERLNFVAAAAPASVQAGLYHGQQPAGRSRL
jgi:hypothetical protein